MAHTHEYQPHPKWPTHHVCRLCGLAVPTRLVPPHLIVKVVQ